MKCYFFGTFNPIHIGHKKIVEEIEKKFNSKVTVVPAFCPPHKETIGFNHRYNMAKIVFGDENVSDIEETIPPPNYSYKTIEKLGKCNFVIGYDAFLNINSWKNPEYLKKNLHFLVVPRDFKREDERFDKLRKEGYDFEIMDFSLVDVSSENIRNKVKRGESIKNLVDCDVENYIYEHGLYK